MNGKLAQPHRVRDAGIENARIVYVQCECGHLVLMERGADECLPMVLTNAQSEFLDHQRENTEP